jgi:hypothetical protein
MMRRAIVVGRARLLPSLGFVLAVAIAHNTLSAEIGPATRCCETYRCRTCPDNYCPKPQPCVPCAPLGCCNDYCPKPLPCLPCPLCYCAPNDYCPKPYCLNLSPCWPAWYTCGAMNCCQPLESSKAVNIEQK